MNRLLTATLFALLGAGCFDPLYEDPDPLGEVTWAVCCVSGQVDTCPCDSPDGCPATFRACAAGTCAESQSQSCGPGKDGGASSSQDGGAGTDAGMTDAGGADAGMESDGGMPFDAGVMDGGGGTDAGVQDGGTDAGTVDAGPDDPGPAYGPCCDPNTHRVTTCACPSSGCANAPFTPCAYARCALAGERCE